MGDEGEVCFYQGQLPRYNKYLEELGRKDCIGCVKDDFNRFCPVKMMVSQNYHDRMMEDYFITWRDYVQKPEGVEAKVLESAD